MGEYFPFRIKIVHTSIISADPYRLLRIYINGKTEECDRLPGK